MKLQTIMLGTGTPVINPEREGPAVLLKYGDQVYLFDCGRGIVRQLVRAKIKLQDVHHVFLTHLHSDHTVGLPDLIYTVGVEGRVKPLTVYGPEGTEKMIFHLKQAYSEDVRIRLTGLEPIQPNSYKIDAMNISEGLVFQNTDLKIFCFLVTHGQWKAFGYKIKTKNETIVISGDTVPCESLVEQAKGCDTLLHEVYSASGLKMRSEDWQKYHKNMHTSSLELGKIAAKINPKLLVLYHQLYWAGSDEDIIADIRQNYQGKIIAAKDLDIIN